MDKKALYAAIARHVQAYPDPNPATNAPWTVAERIDDILRIKAEADAKIAELEAAEAAAARDPAAEQAARNRAGAVDAWLRDLSNTNPDEFERVRKLSFEEQAALAGV